MKILAIRLKNLTSIEGIIDIDFTKEPLKSAGIFSISGVTGAGKSTILDALCLALYSKVPRFMHKGSDKTDSSDVGDKMIKQNDVRNLLRRGSSEGFAEVDFVAIDGKIYRSNWSVRRANNKPSGAIQKHVIRVRCLNDNKELQGLNTELLDQLETLVGLNYEQFTRTVLLAQNDFSTFLKSKGEEKGDLLEKLTGTEVYSELSSLVYRKTKDIEEELKAIDRQKDVIGVLSEDEIRELSNQLMLLDKESIVITSSIDSLQAENNIVISLKSNREKYESKLLKKEEIISENKNSFEELKRTEEALSEFERWYEEHKDDIVFAKSIDNDICSNRLKLESISNIVLEKRSSLQKLNIELETLKDKLLSLITDIKQGLDIESDEFSLEEIKMKYNQLLNDTSNDDKLHLSISKEIEILSAKSLFEKKSSLTSLISLFEEIEKKNISIGEKKKAVESLAISLLETEKLVLDKKSCLDSAQKTLDLAKEFVGSNIILLRSKLKDGMPCSVCGATHHPYYSKKEEILDKFKQVEANLLNAKNRYEEAKAKYDSDKAKHSVLYEDFISLSNELIILNEKTKDEPTKEDALSNLEQVGKEINKLQQLNQEYLALSKKIEVKRKNIISLENNISNYKDLTTSLFEKEGQIKVCRQQLTELENSIEEIQKVISVNLEKLSSIIGLGLSFEQFDKELREKSNSLSSQRNHALRRNKEAVEKLSFITGEVKTIKDIIDDLELKYKSIKDPLNISFNIEKMKAEKAEKNQTIGIIKERLRKNEENTSLLLNLQKEQSAVNKKYEKWSKLNSLIGSADGKKFKIIAQGYTLNILLLHANKHLSYLSNRYKLRQIQNSLNIEVIDCDMCNEVRTVYSLSGGESFIISLALALGLSSLSSKNLHVESLFIDEGFGSLDSESLQTVMYALEQIQMQGKKIGVISHVQEMRERISTQIYIEKMSNGRSKVSIKA